MQTLNLSRNPGNTDASGRPIDLCVRYELFWPRWKSLSVLNAATGKVYFKFVPIELRNSLSVPLFERDALRAVLAEMEAMHMERADPRCWRSLLQIRAT